MLVSCSCVFHQHPVQFPLSDLNGSSVVVLLDMFGQAFAETHHPASFDFSWFYHHHISDPDFVLSIYNTLGQEFMQINSKEDYVRIDLSNLSAGIYFYQYRANLYEDSYVGKFVIK